jgi:hypothetical protein
VAADAGHDLLLGVADVNLQQHQLVGIRVFAGLEHLGHAQV